MLEKALQSIAKRAVTAQERSATLLLRNVEKRTVPCSGLPPSTGNGIQRSVMARVGATSSDSQQTLLDEVEKDFRTVDAQLRLQHRLEGATGVCAVPLHVESVMEAARTYPHALAVETACVLLSAGKCDGAMELLTSWKGPPMSHTLRHKRKATCHLLNTIDTLGHLGDAPTLKIMVELFNASLKEQVVARASKGRGVRCEDFQNVQYPLLTPLGPRRAHLLLIKAVDRYCRIPSQNGATLMEKILLLSHLADTSTLASHLSNRSMSVLPYRLQKTFVDVIQRDSDFDERLLRQMSPRLFNTFVHPAQFDTLQLLETSASEVRFIAREWVTSCMLRTDHLRASTEIVTSWPSLGRQFLGSSTALQRMQRNAELIDLVRVKPRHQRRERRRLDLGESKERVRDELVSLLASRNLTLRRLVARTLLRRPHLLMQLAISPVAVFSACALTFRSERHASHSFSSLCAKAVKCLCRAHEYETAARIVWNHLSVKCSANEKVFRRHKTLIDTAVVCICRAMNDACDRHSGQSWMGHRSLALLRAADASGPIVTPMHCIPVCVGALACGVHFATVSQQVTALFSALTDTAEWVVNMVRLCAGVHSVSQSIDIRRPSTSPLMRGLLHRLYYALPTTPPALNHVPVEMPCRSKVLALWSILHESSLNPRLFLLIASAFLREDIRRDLINGTSLIGGEERKWGSGSAGDALPREYVQVKDEVGAVFMREAAVSVAANCTTDRTFHIMISALRCTGNDVPTSATVGSLPQERGRTACFDRLTFVYHSEYDDDRMTGSPTVGPFSESVTGVLVHSSGSALQVANGASE